ncbi:hypothetical protein VPHD249_0069 [Vibrio phage D249]
MSRFLPFPIYTSILYCCCETAFVSEYRYYTRKWGNLQVKFLNFIG